MPRGSLAPSISTLLEASGLTSQQAKQLALLRVGDAPLLSVEDRDGIYTIVSLIDQLGWDTAYPYIVSQLSPQLSVAEAIRQIVRDSPLIKRPKERFLLDLDKYRRKASSAKGLHTCRACGSKETISVQKQLRSADEPMTTIITCVACGKTWRE
jgi:DNA-directed RNA polymerase subunit M/transcription elongation factor TFIIS